MTNTKQALVTGASARGGAAISRRLHAEGCDLVLHHSPRSADAAAELAAELNAMRADSARLWCAELAAVKLEVPQWLCERRIEICICNASIYRQGTIDDLEDASLAWQVHVLSHAAILSALRPRLRSVVAVTDIHVDRPACGYVWYTTAKAALQAMVLVLAAEWAPEVRCNVVQPGTLPFPEGWKDEVRARSIVESIPAKQIGRFEDLAEAVVWLALRANYVTGQVLAVDGGRSRRLN